MQDQTKITRQNLQHRESHASHDMSACSLDRLLRNHRSCRKKSDNRRLGGGRRRHRRRVCSTASSFFRRISRSSTSPFLALVSCEAVGSVPCRSPAADPGKGGISSGGDGRRWASRARAVVERLFRRAGLDRRRRRDRRTSGAASVMILRMCASRRRPFAGDVFAQNGFEVTGDRDWEPRRRRARRRGSSGAGPSRGRRRFRGSRRPGWPACRSTSGSSSVEVILVSESLYGLGTILLISSFSSLSAALSEIGTGAQNDRA